MSLLKVKDRFQVTLPTALRRKARVEIGDLIDAEVRNDGEIRMRVKRLVDRSIDEGLADVRAGRVHGPFDTAEELIESLRASKKKRKR